VVTTRSQRVSSVSRVVAWSAIPALLIRTSRRPKVSTVESTIRRAPSNVATES